MLSKVKSQYNIPSVFGGTLHWPTLLSTDNEGSLSSLRKHKKKLYNDAGLAAKLESNVREIRQHLDLFFPKILPFLRIESQVCNFRSNLIIDLYTSQISCELDAMAAYLDSKDYDPVSFPEGLS